VSAFPGRANNGLMHSSKAAVLIDHLIGAREQRLRHFEAERLGGLQIDHQLVFGRRLHRQVGRLLAPEDAVDVAGGSPVLIDKIRPVGHQPAGGRHIARDVHGGKLVPRRRGKPDTESRPAPLLDEPLIPSRIPDLVPEIPPWSGVPEMAAGCVEETVDGDDPGPASTMPYLVSVDPARRSTPVGPDPRNLGVDDQAADAHRPGVAGGGRERACAVSRR